MALWIWFYALYNQLAGGIIGATLASQVPQLRDSIAMCMSVVCNDTVALSRLQ